MATESYVQPPANSTDGPHIATLEKTISGSTDSRHHYAINAGRMTKIIDYTLTRSTSTGAYTAGFALTATSSGGSVAGHTYADISRDNGGSGAIAHVVCADSANETLKPSIELWLFGGNTIPTADSDGTVFTPSDSELLNFLGLVTFTSDSWFSGTTGSGGSSVANGTIQPGVGSRILFECGSSVSSIWGLTVMRNAYAPIASEVFTFRLFVEQD